MYLKSSLKPSLSLAPEIQNILQILMFSTAANNIKTDLTLSGTGNFQKKGFAPKFLAISVRKKIFLVVKKKCCVIK